MLLYPWAERKTNILLDTGANNCPVECGSGSQNADPKI